MSAKILVVDDEPPIVDMLAYNLKRANYEVLIARDGQEALDKARREQPDLIILDLMLPKVDGLTLCQRLRRDERTARIPILMLTGVSGILEEMEAHKDETFEHPYDSLREALKRAIRELRDDGLVKPEMFVDKPVDPDDFIARARKLIGE